MHMFLAPVLAVERHCQCVFLSSLPLFFLSAAGESREGKAVLCMAVNVRFMVENNVIIVSIKMWFTLFGWGNVFLFDWKTSEMMTEFHQGSFQRFLSYSEAIFTCAYMFYMFDLTNISLSHVGENSIEWGMWCMFISDVPLVLDSPLLMHD